MSVFVRNHPVRILLIAIATTLFTGCASQSSTIIERDGISAVEVPPDRKVAFIKRKDTNLYWCAPRQGDIADTSGAGVSLGDTSSSEETATEQSGQGVVTLGGRTPDVLLSREFMFRACELALNTNATQEESLDIYKRFLDSLEKISSLQVKSAGTASTTAAAPTITRENVSETTEAKKQ